MSEAAEHTNGIPRRRQETLLDTLAESVAERVLLGLQMECGQEPFVLDAAQVGVMIGRTRRAVLQMYYKRQIPGFKIGNRVSFDRRRILAWLDSLQA